MHEFDAIIAASFCFEFVSFLLLFKILFTSEIVNRKEINSKQKEVAIMA